MGMFDTVLVHKSLLAQAIEGTDINLEVGSDGYYDFQTKDLENSLTTFFLREDGSFVWEKREYKYVEPDTDSDRKWGHMELVGEPEILIDTRSAYITFYDFYNTNTERVWVEFTAHVKDGKLAEPIKLVAQERTNLEQEAIRHKIQNQKWEKVRSSWQWQLATVIFEVPYKLRKFFYPLTNQIGQFEKWLRDEAKRIHDVL